MVFETGDFNRFRKGKIYAALLGLAPGERSSGEHINRTEITKAEDSHLRRLLIEVAQTICKGKVGYKSKNLRLRQNACTAEVVAYANKTKKNITQGEAEGMLFPSGKQLCKLTASVKGCDPFKV